ncbi:uncharacterized protein LOC134779087 [Penaeus indicus]|uniref:uncharacterized protein LOC134779087 n=1 Tax=Penaeus indicus TaxID=29960 RepID=UPI00300C8823
MSHEGASASDEVVSMVSSGPIWSLSGLNGPMWSQVLPYGLKCSHMVSSAPIWSLSGLKWSHVVSSGPMWSQVVSYGPIWSQVVSYGPIWSQVVPCGLKWSLSGLKWSQVIPCGPMWSQIRRSADFPWSSWFMLVFLTCR